MFKRSCELTVRSQLKPRSYPALNSEAWVRKVRHPQSLPWEPKLNENAVKPSVCPRYPPITEEVQMTGLVPMYSYVAAGPNQICQKGKCTCVRGFFRNNDKECEGKFLHF